MSRWPAGCSSVNPEGCLIGAGVGAVIGGGLGAAGAAGPGGGSSKAYAIGVPAGDAAGAILGGLAGCFAVRPKPEAPPPPEQPAPAQQKIILRGVHFNFNRAVIRSVDRPVLDEAAETLKANPNVKVYVNGYCDAIGSARYNLRLSQRRADAVAS